MVGESDDTDPSVRLDQFDEVVTERDITPIVPQRLCLTRSPFLRLDDGAWWEDD
jgi:hypothetical protein